MQDKIQMTDLKIQYASMKTEIDAAIQDVLNECSFIQGKQVGLFEEEVARYFGVKFAVGVASGTDALVLALLALGIGHGDEVITTPFTFIATAEAISRAGATPVFCDIDPQTFNIDPKKMESRITARTKAVLPVHLYGMPCAMDQIMAIVEKYQLKLVEDCAQSFGSEYKNKKTGTFGDAGCLSFFPAKTLGCYGDGGMIITNSEEVAQKAKMLRNHGSTRKYVYGMHGFNSRLDTLQAAALRVKLKHIHTWIDQRIEKARLYNALFSGSDKVVVPLIQGKDSVQSYKHTFNYYNIRVPGRRDLLQAHLTSQKIPSMIYYPLSLHLQESYKDLGYQTGDMPVAEKAQTEVLSLPMYPELPQEQIGMIADVVLKF